MTARASGSRARRLPRGAAGHAIQRVLLLGFAGLGEQDHQSAMYLPALRAHPGFELMAAWPAREADEKRAAAAGVPVVADLEAALADPAIDVVSVAVPLESRGPTIAAALRAGKHVVADKPLAASADEVVMVLDAARAADRLVLPAHHHRWHGAIRSAAAAVAAGRVGLPWNVQADFLVSGGAPVPDGELLNFAVYPLDVLRALLGLDARRVHVMSRRYWHEGADDFATLLVDYHNGVTGTITLGRSRELGDVTSGGLARHRYRISGSHGTLAVDATRPGLAVRTGTGAASAWTGGGTVAALVADLHRAITANSASPIPPADVLDVYRTLDAAQQSLRTGHPCEIG